MARQLLDEGVSFGNAKCSSGTHNFAPNKKLSVFPTGGLSLLVQFWMDLTRFIYLASLHLKRRNKVHITTFFD